MSRKIIVNTNFTNRLQDIIDDKCDGNKTSFAKKIGASGGNVTDWINGRSKPGLEKLICIYEVFGVDITWLATGEGEMHLDDLEAENKRLKKENSAIKVKRYEISKEDRASLLGIAERL